MPSANQVRTEARDFYEVLGAKPSASAAELRAAFREAVLRHHPDRATSSDVATRRTSMLNRAWTALRDPVRRLHYDHDLEMGREEMLEWPIEAGELRRADATTGSPGRAAVDGEPLASAPMALGRRIPRSRRGVHGRAGGPGALDRRASHRRRGLARSLRAVLAPFRGALLRRARPDRGPARCAREGSPDRSAAERDHRHGPARRLPCHRRGAARGDGRGRDCRAPTRRIAVAAMGQQRAARAPRASTGTSTCDADRRPSGRRMRSFC